MKNINEILDFLEQKQIYLESTGTTEEIAFQLAITYLTPEEVNLWHNHNSEKRLKQK